MNESDPSKYLAKNLPEALDIWILTQSYYLQGNLDFVTYQEF